MSPELCYQPHGTWSTNAVPPVCLRERGHSGHHRGNLGLGTISWDFTAEELAVSEAWFVRVLERGEAQ